MKKVYFDKVGKKEVVDVSGVKPLAEIKEEFYTPTTELEEVDVNDDESQEIKNGKLKKVTKAEIKAQQDAEKAKYDKKRKDIKDATDFDELKTALLNYFEIK